MIRKYFDSRVDFIVAGTKTFIHYFHNYPAMMILQTAERLILKYGKQNILIFILEEIEHIKFGFDLLNQSIDQRVEKDEKRAKEVQAFYQDYQKQSGR